MVFAWELSEKHLKIQRAIVVEIEAEQALVAANPELVARFKQKIQTTLARVWDEDGSPPSTSSPQAAGNPR